MSMLKAVSLKAICATVAAAMLFANTTCADTATLATTRASFADVVFELENAILTRGLAIHSTGNQFARMLERTGEAVGSTVVIYREATFVEICSAKLARQMVEAEPSLMGNCPFVLFAYELASQPGEVRVGFRRLMPGATAAGQKAVAETEALLDGIVRDAIK